MDSWLFFHYADSGSSCKSSIWRFRLNSIALQGTRILEEREIRCELCMVAEDAPPQHTSSRFVKYTGDLALPVWEDVELGRVFGFPWHIVKNAESQKDKFETLCRVKADISSAPYTSKLLETGKTVYERCYGVILLVGLTELKAQIGWIDSETVRVHFVPLVPIYLIRLPHA